MSITAINDFLNIIILLIIRVIIAAQLIVEIDGQLPPYSSHTLRNDADEEYSNEEGNGEFDAFSNHIEVNYLKNLK